MMKRKAQSLKNYFDEEDEDDIDTCPLNHSVNLSNNDEIDPLDAFMYD